jgi:hypothetical protein
MVRHGDCLNSKIYSKLRTILTRTNIQTLYIDGVNRFAAKRIQGLAA